VFFLGNIFSWEHHPVPDKSTGHWLEVPRWWALLEMPSLLLHHRNLLKPKSLLGGYVYIYIPICSLYGIFTYISPKKCPNVGKYSIHGASGIDKKYVNRRGPTTATDNKKSTIRPCFFPSTVEWLEACITQVLRRCPRFGTGKRIAV
jgi:hypothetical protein